MDAYMSQMDAMATERASDELSTDMESPTATIVEEVAANMLYSP